MSGPPLVQVRLTAGVLHELHHLGFVGDGKQRLVTPRLQSPRQQRVGHVLVLRIALVEHFDCDLLKFSVEKS